VAPELEAVRDALGHGRQVVVAALPRAQLRALTEALPAFGNRLVWAGDEETSTGEVRLLRPFDPSALQWFYPDD
jgi:hypothetical protein